MWWVIGSGAIFVLVALRAILLAVRLNRRTSPSRLRRPVWTLPKSTGCADRPLDGLTVH
jgi:hypothetical protein